MGKALALASLLTLAACQTTSAGFCAIAKPIRPAGSEIDAMSAEQVTALLAHNEKGRALCGWKAH